jgi:hypothetical protein
MSASQATYLKNLHHTHILPDEESSSFTVSRALLPAVRRLKWSFQRDKLARMVREGTICGITPIEGSTMVTGFANWFEARGRGIVQDGERVRLALCPDVMTRIKRYEAPLRTNNQVTLCEWRTCSH